MKHLITLEFMSDETDPTMFRHRVLVDNEVMYDWSCVSSTCLQTLHRTVCSVVMDKDKWLPESSLLITDRLIGAQMSLLAKKEHS